MHWPTFRALFVALLLITAGLAVALPAEADEASPAIAAEVARVDGRAVEFWSSRAARPRATLVFENGLMLPLTTWQAVVRPLTDEANVLLYNRPGVGLSELPTEPQDAADTSRRLRELLRASDLPPPYIVIGHSLGGQYGQLYARLYPDDVSALLLVDALPPGVVKPVADFPWYTQVGLKLLVPDHAQREIASAHAMGEVLLDGARAFEKPMIRLVAAPDPRLAKPEGLVKDLLKGVVYAEDFGVWAIDPDVAERRLDQIYPQSIVRSVPAHHRMQEAAPAVVVDAIRELIAKTGAGSMQGGRAE